MGFLLSHVRCLDQRGSLYITWCDPCASASGGSWQRKLRVTANIWGCTADVSSARNVGQHLGKPNDIAPPPGAQCPGQTYGSPSHAAVTPTLATSAAVPRTAVDIAIWIQPEKYGDHSVRSTHANCSACCSSCCTPLLSMLEHNYYSRGRKERLNVCM